MAYKYVNLSIQDKIGVIAFNYPEKLNSLSKVFVDDVMLAIDELTQPQVHCIIMRAPRGAKVFSAGHDIRELPMGHSDPLPYADPLRQIIRKIQRCPKPIVAMVEGSVWGGAFEVVMSTDIVIAAQDSTFAMTPANLGVPYNLVGIHNLLRDAGYHIIKEMIFTASPISAERAMAVGIVNHVLPVDELEAFTFNMARTISEKAGLAIGVIKEEMRVLGEAHSMTPEEYERIQDLRREVYHGSDYHEGLKAFMEKRKPNFQGQ